ncbi:MAG: CRISPR-associated endonuclease Cas6 [Saprospiraceae bacterium]
MPKLRYLRIRFAQPIFAYDIPKFRAAVIEKTERVSALFHNHKDDTEVLYRYPLIQYKVTNKKASIICLEEGSDDIHYLLQHRELDLRVGDSTNSYTVEDVDLHYHMVQTWHTTFEYSLLNWIALNQKHHQRFKELEGDEKAQIELLSSILRGNILAFAKGINWWVEDTIAVEITKIKEIKTLPIHKNYKDVLTFSLNFRTNVSLPDYIGLGKRVSIGFGTVKQFRSNSKKMIENG